MEGFRIAEDLGAVQASSDKPSAFEVELAEAQRIERERRGALAEIKPPGG